MDLDVSLVGGDGSGRPDTSGVDRGKALYYAERMFWAVVCVDFQKCAQIHDELNKDWDLYSLSLDLFRAMCTQRDRKSGYWKEYTS